MNKPRIYADFMKTDDAGRLVLTCVGTWKDFEQHDVAPREGLAITFYTDDADDNGERDDLLVEGVLRYDGNARQWLAEIDRDTLRHVSDE